MEMQEFKTLLEQQGKAFDAFKSTLETEMKGKLAKDDPILTEKLAKIEKSLDDAVEAKARIDAALVAEKAEREELEKKLNRMGISGAGSEAEAKAMVELKTFNAGLASLPANRKKPFVELTREGMDSYKSASMRYIREGKDALLPDELKTLSVGSDPDGGYWVTPDVSGRIVSKVFETSPVRQYASIQQISTDSLDGIEDTGEAGAGYAGEFEEGSDSTTPQIGKWSIPVFWIATQPRTSQQLIDDASIDVEGWLANKVSDKFSRFENAEFVGGTSKIKGFALGYPTAADAGSGATWGSVGYLATGVNGDFAAADKGDKIYEFIGLLKNSYLSNAAFFTRRSVITKIRQFKVSGTGTAYLWEPSFQAGQPERIAGFPVARMEDFPALSANSFSLAFGDLRSAYQIVDRQGITVLRDNLTSKPYVKFYTRKRTGGGVVNFEAIKLMKFATS